VRRTYFRNHSTTSGLATGEIAKCNMNLRRSNRPVWQVIDEINYGLPADTWENVPTDGSINLDNYLYGTPKQQP
jgi:hypothetical protein